MHDFFALRNSRWGRGAPNVQQFMCYLDGIEGGGLKIMNIVI